MNYSSVDQNLPLDWFVSDRYYDLDRRLITDSAEYVGHESVVPDPGDYRTLHWKNHAQALIRNDKGPVLMQNVCNHRQGIMLQGQGNTQNIVCPLHGWTYARSGQMLGAPHFRTNPCLHLASEPLGAYQGLLFRKADSVSAALSGLPVFGEYDFGSYRLHNSVVEHYDFDWKTFIEVYLELYHVDPYHPGLSSLVDTGQIEWQKNPGAQAQVLEYRLGTRSPSGAYESYKKILEANDLIPRHGAIWCLVYPNIMLEVYPSALVVSVVVPTGVGQCMNLVEFYYPEDVCWYEPGLVAAHKAAYLETSIEDQKICESIQAGRHYLHSTYSHNGNRVFVKGPVLNNYEEGLVDFYEYLRYNYNILKG